MLDFLKEELQFLIIIPIWILIGMNFAPLAYLVIPATLLLMKNRDMYPEIFMGFLLILILSDTNPEYVNMRWVKTFKNVYILVIAGIFILDREKFAPHSRIFSIFLPFIVYSYFPLIFSGDPIIGIQKTISYSLLILIVPNYILYSYRKIGWPFFRNLVLFIMVILVTGYLISFINPRIVFISGRFRAYFGNPNGLGIFTYLFFVLFTLINFIKKDLFSVIEKVVIYVLIVYFLILCGSRTSLASVLIFLLLTRLYAISPYLGFIVFLISLAMVEIAISNIHIIVYYVGLQDFMRLETLDDGSGRYFAWGFAWAKIQDFFLFGGGFANDEYIMRQHYPYLQSMGHHGGVHNSYLTMWFNMGLIGVLIYFRSFILIFIRASKQVKIAYPVMLSVFFSILYESWINGSLNPFTITLFISLTIMSESEIYDWNNIEEIEPEDDREETHAISNIPTP